MVFESIILALGRLRKEDHKFKNRLDLHWVLGPGGGGAVRL